jgi:Protein of unknown function (DUF3891)
VLVRPDDDGALAIGQLSHAWLSGQLARAWGNERFGRVQPREEVVLGASQHDIGWALADLEPRLDTGTGLPRSFLDFSAQEHVALWSSAPERLLSQCRYAALVVSLHGAALSELRARNTPEDAAALRPHVEREHARQAELCALLGVSNEHAQRVQRQMWAWDGLSLALCLRWRPFTAHEVPGARGTLDVELREGAEGTHTLDPWPFSCERVEVRCEARRLSRRYDDEAAMRADLERARPVDLAFTLLPA